MSQENVDVIRALIPPPDVDLALLFRDDILFQQASAALGPLIDPGIESVAAFRGDATYAGIEGFRKMWLDWLEPWATYHSRVDDLIDAGDRVAVLIRDRARPHDTRLRGRTDLGLGVGGPTGQDRPGPVLPRPRSSPRSRRAVGVGFDDYRFEVQRIVDCGGDDVLVVGREVDTGAMSGGEVHAVDYELLTIRNGLIVCIREFYDEGNALEAAGLAE